MQKRFDKQLHTQFDIPARIFVKELFKNNTEYSVEESEKVTDVDFRILKNGQHVGFLETEVKTNWSGKNFIYPNVNFAERKWKYCVLEKPTLFLMLNKEMDNYLCVHGKDILNSKLEMVKNKYVANGESFFKVDIKKVIFNNIEEKLRLL